MSAMRRVLDICVELGHDLSWWEGLDQESRTLWWAYYDLRVEERNNA